MTIFDLATTNGQPSDGVMCWTFERGRLHKMGYFLIDGLVATQPGEDQESVHLPTDKNELDAMYKNSNQWKEGYWIQSVEVKTSVATAASQ
jgi:hypothetical protein